VKKERRSISIIRFIPPTRIRRKLTFHSMVRTYDCVVLVPTSPFPGTGISVFGVLPNLTDSQNQPSATFTLDNGTPIAFNTVPPDQLRTIHQVPIFQSSNLTLNYHQLQIEAHDNSSTLWLDFFMYEQPANSTSRSTGSTSANHSVESGAIAGGVVGGIVVVIVGMALLIWLWRKRQSKLRSDNISPFVAADPTFTGSGILSLSRISGYTTPGFSYSALSSDPATRPTTSQSNLYHQPIRKEPVRSSPTPQSLSTDARPQPDVGHSQVDTSDNNPQPPPYHQGS